MTRPQPDDDSESTEAIIDGQLTMLMARFGDRLRPDEWSGVRDALSTQRERAAKLRDVSLANGDEPATSFVVGPGRD